MGHVIVQFRRNNLAWSLPLLVASVPGVMAALVLLTQLDVSLATILTALILVGLCSLQARSAWQRFKWQYPVVEIYDYCVIDARSFKEWVLWDDVDEIVLDAGAIFLIVRDEAKHARTNTCFCDVLATLSGQQFPSKLMISPFGLECSFGDLLAAIRIASRPYEIPIRRLPSSSVQRTSAPAPSPNPHDFPCGHDLGIGDRGA